MPSQDTNIKPASTPLVSVLIPCYNAAAHIAETLDSVITQTYTNWECIVVDDHSTDHSTDIVQSYCDKYPKNIKLYTNPRKGACAARNVAFEHCSGEYIQYLDADDLISPDKFEKQINLLRNNPNHISVCNNWNFYSCIEDAYNTDKDYIYSTNNSAEFLINLWGGKKSIPHYVAVHAYLSPRHLIKKACTWNENLYKDQDGEFFARVLLGANGISYEPSVKCYYRKHQDGENTSSQKRRQHLQSNLHATQLKEGYLLAKTTSKEAKYAIATQYKHVAIEAWPQYPDITKQALATAKALRGSSYLPVLGGKLIEGIKFTLGWKAAKAFSYYMHKLL